MPVSCDQKNRPKGASQRQNNEYCHVQNDLVSFTGPLLKARGHNMPRNVGPDLNGESSLVSLKDLNGWESSVDSFTRTTQAKCLDVRAMPLKELRLEILNMGRVFNSLVGSEVTQMYLGRETPKPVDDVSRDSSYLDLRIDEWGHFIKVLPKTKIEKLNIVNCKLETYKVLSLLEVLKNTQVTHLDLSGNPFQLDKSQMEEFLCHVKDSRLKSIHISGDFLTPFLDVADFIHNLLLTDVTSLAVLNFFKNCQPLTDYDNHDMHFQNMLSSLKYNNLTELALEGTWSRWNQKWGDSFAKALGMILPDSKLEKLSVRETGISDRGVDFLVGGLVKSKITYLNLGCNKIYGNNTLGGHLKRTKIKELNLEGNPIMNERIFEGKNFFQGPLNVLTLNNCFLWRNTLLLSSISGLRSSALTSLDLSNNLLGPTAIQILAEEIIHTKLTHLNLSENYITGENFSVLGEKFKKSKLKHIGFDRTVEFPSEVTASGVKSLIENIKDTTIATVTLRDNSPNGDFRMFASIFEIANILALDLSYNSCSNLLVDRACQLKLLSSMTTLNLAFNHIGDKEVAVLAQCLPETQIIILRLSNNKISCRGAAALATRIKKTKLRYLDMRENNIEAAGTECLAENLKSTCITYLKATPKPNVKISPKMRRNLFLIDTVSWENRKRIQKFADLLKKTEIFSSSINFIEYHSKFGEIAVNACIESYLSLYKMVSKEPQILSAIKQDERISFLKKQGWFEYSQNKYTAEYSNINIFIEDSDLINKIMTEQTSIDIDGASRAEDTSISQKQFLNLVFKKFCRFLTLSEKDAASDMEPFISKSKGIEPLLQNEVADLLLSRHHFCEMDEHSGKP